MTRSGPQWHVIRNVRKTVDFQMERHTQTNKEEKDRGEKQCWKRTGGEHTHIRRACEAAGRQAGRARNEPGQEIRFLGGSAVGTGLQSTAAWGTGRSKARRQGGDGDSIIKPVQGSGCLGMSCLGIPLLPFLCRHDPAAVGETEGGKQQRSTRKKERTLQ